MLWRLTLLTLVPLACAACAAEPAAPKVMGFHAVAAPMAVPTASETSALRASRVSLPVRKSMADKVLTAIALERVTGRKPDPSRLADAQ